MVTLGIRLDACSIQLVWEMLCVCFCVCECVCVCVCVCCLVPCAQWINYTLCNVDVLDG